MLTFLSILGARSYIITRHFGTGASADQKLRRIQVSTLKNHYELVPSGIAQGFHFYCRNQRSGETIAVYVAELKCLSVECNFGQILDEALRDRFVCGILENSIQRRLLTESELTFQKAVQIAQAMEASSRDVKALQANSGAEL